MRRGPIAGLILCLGLLLASPSYAPGRIAYAGQTLPTVVTVSVEYDNGDSYQGQAVANKRHGSGTYKWADGTSFVGTWKEGQFGTYGKLSFLSGETYNGSFSPTSREGFGSYVWSNGDAYAGIWAKDLPNGYGTYKWANGDQYQGNWKDGTMDGKGKYTFKNGTYLNGKWSQNEFLGQ